MTGSVLPIKPGLFTTDDPRAPQAALRGSRCRLCREVFFPPRQVCPRCRVRGTLDPIALGRSGRIVAVTQVARVPAPYRNAYFLAEIDLDDGVRMRARVEAPANEHPKVGDAVELALTPLFAMPDGAQVYGYVARLAEKKEAR